jgi:hypothetical protein
MNRRAIIEISVGMLGGVRPAVRSTAVIPLFNPATVG